MPNLDRPVARIEWQDYESGTITGNTISQSVSISNCEEVYDVSIRNLGAGEISVKFNSTSNSAITIPAYSKLIGSDEMIRAIYLTNLSGTDSAYSVVMSGTRNNNNV